MADSTDLTVEEMKRIPLVYFHPFPSVYETCFDHSTKPVGDLILTGRVSIWEREVAYSFLQNLVYIKPTLENWVNILLSHPRSRSQALYETGLRLMLSENAFYSGILIGGRLDILDAEQQAKMYEIPLLKYNFLIHFEAIFTRNNPDVLALWLAEYKKSNVIHYQELLENSVSKSLQQKNFVILVQLYLVDADEVRKRLAQLIDKRFKLKNFKYEMIRLIQVLQTNNKGLIDAIFRPHLSKLLEMRREQPNLNYTAFINNILPHVVERSIVQDTPEPILYLIKIVGLEEMRAYLNVSLLLPCSSSGWPKISVIFLRGNQEIARLLIEEFPELSSDLLMSSTAEICLGVQTVNCMTSPEFPILEAKQKDTLLLLTEFIRNHCDQPDNPQPHRLL